MWEAERLERVEADKIWEELNGSMPNDNIIIESKNTGKVSATELHGRRSKNKEGASRPRKARPLREDN